MFWNSENNFIMWFKLRIHIWTFKIRFQSIFHKYFEGNNHLKPLNKDQNKAVRGQNKQLAGGIVTNWGEVSVRYRWPLWDHAGLNSKTMLLITGEFIDRLEIHYNTLLCKNIFKVKFNNTGPCKTHKGSGSRWLHCVRLTSLCGSIAHDRL